MKTAEENIFEIFDFLGSWGRPSKCGLRRIEKKEKVIIIAIELYKDNPGSSITSVAASLVMQIVEKYHIDIQKLIYIESNPKMNSKLSFYDEEYYIVEFENNINALSNPSWKLLSKEKFKKIVNEV